MLNQISKMKKVIVSSAFNAREGHIPSAFSILDILWVLYDRILNIDPAKPNKPDRDRFILSKGHASLGLYTVLAEKGFFSSSDLKTFAKFDSVFGGHPDCTKVPGIEASTGSLGHGFPIAVGVALGLKISEIKSRVFVLVGDGECNEGSIWESALLAAHHTLTNLCCIVDYNHSTDRALRLGDLSRKFAAFGWESSVINGHDHVEIFEALTHLSDSRPTAIIAETVKGYGCKIMENKAEWHHKSPNEAELKKILENLV
jgi:transketolase